MACTLNEIWLCLQRSWTNVISLFWNASTINIMNETVVRFKSKIQRSLGSPLCFLNALFFEEWLLHFVCLLFSFRPYNVTLLGREKGRPKEHRDVLELWLEIYHFLLKIFFFCLEIELFLHSWWNFCQKNYDSGSTFFQWVFT